MAFRFICLINCLVKLITLSDCFFSLNNIHLKLFIEMLEVLNRIYFKGLFQTSHVLFKLIEIILWWTSFNNYCLSWTIAIGLVFHGSLYVPTK